MSQQRSIYIQAVSIVVCMTASGYVCKYFLMRFTLWWWSHFTLMITTSKAWIGFEIKVKLEQYSNSRTLKCHHSRSKGTSKTIRPLWGNAAPSELRRFYTGKYDDGVVDIALSAEESSPGRGLIVRKDRVRSVVRIGSGNLNFELRKW